MINTRRWQETDLPSDEDMARLRSTVQEEWGKSKRDHWGRAHWGKMQETKRVYRVSANHIVHTRAAVRMRAIREEHRLKNGGAGVMGGLEVESDGRSCSLFARELQPDDAAKSDNEDEQEDEPRRLNYSSCQMFDHRIPQQIVFETHMPALLDLTLNGARACLILYGAKRAGKSYTLFGKAADTYGGKGGDSNENANDDNGEVLSEHQDEAEEMQKQQSTELPVAVSAEEAALETQDIDHEWLATDDPGEDSGIAQRAAAYIFEKRATGHKHQQTHRRVKLKVFGFCDREDEAWDLLSHDQHGSIISGPVEWDADLEAFAIEEITERVCKNADQLVDSMLYARERAQESGLERCSIVYQVSVLTSGIGDPTWRSIVGDQLPEGQPQEGHAYFVECASFEIGKGFPDRHGNDGVFKEHNNLRVLMQVLEGSRYNSLPALRKKVTLPYRSTPLTRILSPVLRPGGGMMFMGCVTIEEKLKDHSLHTLWCARVVQKPRSHSLRWKRAKKNMMILNLLNKKGSIWQARGADEKLKRRQEMKAEVSANKRELRAHLIMHEHYRKEGGTGAVHEHGVSAEHERQRARLLRRTVSGGGASSLMAITKSNSPDSMEALKRVRTRYQGHKQLSELKRQEEERLLDTAPAQVQRSTPSCGVSPVGRRRRTVLQNAGSALSAGLLSPALQIIKPASVVES